MIRRLVAVFVLASSPVCAQQAHDPAGHMNHGAMMKHQHGMMAAPAPAADGPTQPGQAAFAAIQEIVRILEDDPQTDWSKVDIEALRQHLVDMSNVTLDAVVSTTPVPGGLQFVVTGSGAVRDSIRRMVGAHAAAMTGAGGWTFAAAERDDGATLTVVVPLADLPKLKALGFIGVMTRGMHHQEHHLMIARGGHPHR